MKNYLKKQAKKTLSLMLAVLMLMSCWVWIAPEKAEAANTAAEGYYQIRVMAEIPDRADDGMNLNQWTVDYKYNNGRGDQASSRVTLNTINDLKTATATDVQTEIANGWVYGWPTAVHLSLQPTDNSTCGASDRAFRLEMVVFEVYNNETKTWVPLHDQQMFNIPEAGISYDWNVTANAPLATTMKNITATTASLTVPSLGSGSEVSTTPVTADVYDQYGVKLLGVTPDSYHVAEGENGEDISDKAKGMWATRNTDGKGYVTINENMQINYALSAYYLVVGVTLNGKTCTTSQKITFTYPQYTMTVNADGSISGLNAAIDMSDKTTVLSKWEAAGAYGQEKTPYPTGTATATGYTFKGFWTKKQPTSGDASYNAFESVFATPVETAKYNEYKNTQGAEVSTSGDYEIVTLNGKKYCDGGSQWNPADPKISGAKTYYGWWLSTDITVKFYNVDGSYIETKPVKYGMTGSDIQWPEPLSDYDSGAYHYKTFSKTWISEKGEKVPENSYKFTHNLILTPIYTDVDFDETYNITFIEQNWGDATTKEYSYREDIGGEVPTGLEVPNVISSDLQYSYTFEGWTTVVPEEGKYYHVVREESDFDENNNVIGINKDWIVRGDATYYAVYRRHVKSYVVEFQYTDSTGADAKQQVSVKYGAELTAPADIPVRYAEEGMGYVLQGWAYTNASSTTATINYGASIVFSSANILISSASLDDGANVQPIIIKAAYDSGTPTPYTITFKFRNDAGDLITKTAEVNHNEYITDDTVEQLVAAEEYDDGEALYTFDGSWEITEGAGMGNSYATDDLTGITPTSHMTFEAVYGNPVPFYTVTYIDGSNTYSERVLKGSNLPAWMVNTGKVDENNEPVFEEYLPAMEKTLQGEYTFQGWYDEKQADANYGETNGTKYEKTATVDSNLTLYPQFVFSAFTYTIKFMDYEGKVQLAAGKFEYGQNIEAVTAVANKAAQGRAQDNTYTYEFIGWDKTVPTICEGEDVTFIAQYKPVYRYYDAKWYNSKLVDGEWVIDKSTKTEDDEVVETALLATTHHTYNSKLYNPSIDNMTCPETAPDGQSYVFAGWYYTDANGEAKAYERGMLITGAMELYATYALTSKIYTVTTVVKGAEAEYAVASGSTASAIGDPAAGYVDEAYHDAFIGWYTDECFTVGNEYTPATAVVTADITIYAKFEQSEHKFTNKELIEAPTYYVEGKEAQWCSCDPAQTRTETEIAVLIDEVAPTGTIYLGTQGSWSSTGEPASATDDDPVSIYANADTTLILTINDTGNVDELYNPSGVGKGIAVIQGFISKGVYSQNNQNVESEVVKIFEDTTENLNNTENYVVTLGQYGDLEDGATYIAYYYVRDKAGNVLNRNVRTAKFIYDEKAPTFTITGNSNAETAKGTPTYCDAATVTGIESGATVTVNGAVVNAVYADGAETGTYEIKTAGNYIITVADKAGNKTSKKIVVADDHNIVTREVLSTCTEDGYKTETCSVCGYEKSKTTYKAPGHTTAPVVYEATCTENGYILNECSVCGYSEKVEFEVDENGEFVLDDDGKKIPVLPALGHSYPTKEVPAEEEGGEATKEIVYTVVTAATCRTKGKEISVCEYCDNTITREIPVDADAHTWGTVRTLKATCTADGKTYQSCKLCYTSKDLEKIPATGHKETQWVVTTAATCGEAGVETLQCKKCNAYVDGTDADTVADTREIPATGRHILAVSEDPTKTFEATADKEGQITRYCTQCGEEWVEKVAKIEKYTVKFVGEDGTTEIKTITDAVSGTTVTENDVTKPTKANSADGKYKYTFAGWVNADDNKAVALPFDVTGNITLKATFTQATIIYTHKFVVPTTFAEASTLAAGDELADMTFSDYTSVFSTLMGAMGDSRVPVAEPTFTDATNDAELKKLYKFTFKGWSTPAGEIVTDFTIAEDATFYAVFEVVPLQYDVIYYNGTAYVWSTKVDGGASVTFGGTTPTKDHDADYHYAFDKWYTDATLKTEYKGEGIKAITRLYAGFKGTAHSYDKTQGVVTQKQDCVLPELTTYTCSCGYKLVEQTKPAANHTPGEAVQETVDGVIYSVVYCKVCDAEISRTKTSVTVAFKNYNGVRLATYNLNNGEAIVYAGEEPVKAQSAQYTYTFAGWYVEGDENETVVDLTKATATADIVYVAKFTSTVRTFRVTYVDANNNTIQTQAGIEYNGKVPAFTGTNPTKDYTDLVHYTFTGWSVEEGSAVTSDIVIKPVFDAVDHTYGDDVKTDATCTEDGGITKVCTVCGQSYVSKDRIPATGHDYDEVRTEPDYDNGNNGKVVYTCKNCGDTYEEVLSAELIEVKVTVKDTNGNPRQGITVSLVYADNPSQAVSGTTNQVTGADGIVRFWVKPGNYKALIDGQVTDVVVDDDRNVTGGDVTVDAPEEDDNSCSCSCHRDGFWGTLFRFFHKIIKFFTGRINCCSCPDERY